MDGGAHFFRCDFQAHTPRDPNWEGAGAVEELERQAYAQEFIAACRAKGLQAVAITDHHDVAFFRYIKDAAQAETDADGNPLPSEARIVVFPGMELTLGVPCQALLIFDADFPVDLLEQAAVALSITPAPSTDAKHAPTQRLEHISNFEQLYESLSQRDFLRGRFFVMPHVGESGDFSLLRKGFAAKYKAMPCVGGFVDGSVEQHGTGNAAIVAGENKEWGNKALGLFQTSDSRNRDFRDLGKHTTWVKWARPTAEALRQACLARGSRLSHNVPQLPGVFVTSIEVSNSLFMGPLSLEFNPQYNALIGGRGTGKSTILEYLRWALCDQPLTDHDAELPDFQRRRRDLIQNTLERLSATVSVSFTKNGIAHIVRRKTETNEILLKIGEGEFTRCTEADVRNILPVHAYSQKQLSSVGVKLEELKRFVHAPIKNQLTQIEAARKDLRAQLRSAHEDLERHRGVTSEIAELELERQSLAEQVDKLRQDLSGLTDEDRQTITQQKLYEQEDQVVGDWEAQLIQAARALQEVSDEIAGPPRSLPRTPTPEGDLLRRMYTGLDAWFTQLRDTLSALREGLNKDSSRYALGDYSAALAEWRERRTESLAAYEAAKARSVTHQSTLSQIRDSEERLKRLDTTIAEKKRVLQKLGEPATRFSDRRKEWLALHEQPSELIKVQCAELSALSKGFIRATLLKGHGVERVDEKLRNALRGTKIRSDRYEHLWQRVKGAAEPLAEWDKILDELELLARSTIEDEIKVALPSTPILESLDFTLRERQAIARVLTPGDWIALLLEDLDDLPQFEYRTREGGYINFSVASAGQQATTLMYVLLNQAGPPLIIDQPEDDLDNKIMDEIVHELWTAKTRRQLIFSSHNANLVVNGDAELVVCCDYRVAGDQSGGKVKLEGAIDVSEINEEITAVMEGGREAFTLRRAKYGF
jgi:chromosome segregation protein